MDFAMKSIYFKNNDLICMQSLDDLLKMYIKPIIHNNNLLSIKGLKSKMSQINWKMFFGISPVNINKDNFCYLNPFNYQVMNWFYLNLNTINGDTVIVQYDGDLILEENDGDCLLQNYTGILPGLLYYLKEVLHKKVELLVILEENEKEWTSLQSKHWLNGLYQLQSNINIDIHFIIYDLKMDMNKETVLNYSGKQLNTHVNTDICGYKGYLHQELLYTLGYRSISMLIFGVENVILEELSYLDYFNTNLFNLVKNNIYFYNLSRMKRLSTHVDNLDYQVIENIHSCLKFINK